MEVCAKVLKARPVDQEARLRVVETRPSGMEAPTRGREARPRGIKCRSWSRGVTENVQTYVQIRDG